MNGMGNVRGNKGGRMDILHQICRATYYLIRLAYESEEADE